jgi:hypothetical protein
MDLVTQYSLPDIIFQLELLMRLWMTFFRDSERNLLAMMAEIRAERG